MKIHFYCYRFNCAFLSVAYRILKSRAIKIKKRMTIARCEHYCKGNCGGTITNLKGEFNLQLKGEFPIMISASFIRI